jgi:aspartate racemase
METRPIGMIGGLGPAATAHYYLGLTAAFAARSVAPRLIINQANLPLVLDAAARGDIDAMADHIAERMAELQRAGADVLAIAAVTAHLCMPKLSTRIDAPIIDIIDVTLLELARRDVRRVALMGTRAAVSSRLFGRLEGFTVDPPPEQIDRVHELYLSVVQHGRADALVVAELRKCAAAYRDQLGVDAIVLAGTELALAPPHTWQGINVVDCAQLHIDAIVNASGLNT